MFSSPKDVMWKMATALQPSSTSPCTRRWLDETVAENRIKAPPLGQSEAIEPRIFQKLLRFVTRAIGLNQRDDEPSFLPSLRHVWGKDRAPWLFRMRCSSGGEPLSPVKEIDAYRSSGRWADQTKESLHNTLRWCGEWQFDPWKRTEIKKKEGNWIETI